MFYLTFLCFTLKTMDRPILTAWKNEKCVLVIFPHVLEKSHNFLLTVRYFWRETVVYCMWLLFGRRCSKQRQNANSWQPSSKREWRSESFASLQVCQRGLFLKLKSFLEKQQPWRLSILMAQRWRSWPSCHYCCREEFRSLSRKIKWRWIQWSALLMIFGPPEQGGPKKSYPDHWCLWKRHKRAKKPLFGFKKEDSGKVEYFRMMCDVDENIQVSPLSQSLAKVWSLASWRAVGKNVRSFSWPMAKRLPPSATRCYSATTRCSGNPPLMVKGITCTQRQCHAVVVDVTLDLNQLD